MSEEQKIDKRTKKYRDQKTNEGSTAQSGTASDQMDRGEDNQLAAPDELDSMTATFEKEHGLRLDKVETKLDAILDIAKELLDRTPIKIGPPTLEPSATAGPAMTPVKDFTKCMVCGGPLDPVETPRRFPEACHACVWKNRDVVADGTETCAHGIPLHLQDNCLQCHELKQVS